MTTQPIVVWAEIPVKNLEAGVKFYDAVFGFSTTIDRSGPMPTANLNDNVQTVGANLYEGEAAPGNIIHFGLADGLEAGIARLEAAGGTVTSPAIEIPVGRFVHALDPDGNKIGLFEAKAG